MSSATTPTREINLPPADALALLEMVKEEAWHFVGTGAGTKVTNLALCIDGIETCHTIHLRDDGTWTARTHITP